MGVALIKCRGIWIKERDKEEQELQRLIGGDTDGEEEEYEEDDIIIDLMSVVAANPGSGHTKEFTVVGLKGGHIYRIAISFQKFEKLLGIMGLQVYEG